MRQITLAPPDGFTWDDVLFAKYSVLVIAENPDGTFERKVCFARYKETRRAWKHFARPFINGRKHRVYIWRFNIFENDAHYSAHPDYWNVN